MIRNIFVFILITLLQTKVFAQVKTLELNSNWTFHNKKESKSYPAQVPGSIYSDLYNNHLIPDPYFGDNEKQLQWIEKEIWIYECRFTLSNKELQSQNIRLNLDGIDTYANVYLNDSLILQTQSMFLAYHKEIKNLLKENNILHIEILPPLSQTPKDDSIKYPGGPQAHVRKAAFQFGWDWGPRFAAGGIWRNVSLEFIDKAHIDYVYFQLIKLDSTKAFYHVIIDYNSEEIGNHNLIIECPEMNISEKIRHYASVSYAPINLEIPNPKLWWPHGDGEAFLYNFNIRIEQNGKILDQVNQKIGIREIELVNKDDAMGTSFYFKINGRPIYITGTNYVPQDIFVGTEEDKAYNSRKLIADVVKSNMNMIRIWGGGVYESDAFYDLCDSAGIMVWQDFMFANSVYPDDSNFLFLVEKEAQQQITRLQNHPSIALWCGNNEISEAWHNWGWQKQFGYSPTDSARLWNNYRNIFETILPRAVGHFSNGVPYWQSSPQYGRGNPKSYSHGDLHYWGVWHDGHSFDSLENKTGRFMSEFGFQSYPSISSIATICDDEDFGVESTQLQNHQKHSRGDAIIDKYMMEEYGMIPEEFDNFVYLSQILQSKGIAQGLKAQRRNQPFCMGSLYWQLNDAWPAISWSGIEYNGQWKPMQYAVRDAYHPYLVSHEINNDICSIYTISELDDSLKTTLHIRVMDFYGNTSFDTTVLALQNGKASKLQYQLGISRFNPRKQFILAEYFLHDDFLLNREFIYLNKDKDLDLPKADLEISQSFKNGKTFIHLKSNTLVRNIWFTRTDGKVGVFSSNNFDLAPNNQWTITIESEKQLELQWWTLNGVMGK